MQSMGEALAAFNVPMAYPDDAFCRWQNPDGCKLLKRDNEEGIALLRERWHPKDCITERHHKSITRKWTQQVNCPMCVEVETRLCKCDADIILANGKKVMNRNAANLPNEGDEKNFKNFDSKRNGAEGAFVAASQFTRGGSITLLCLEGFNGSGKTHLAEAIGRRFIAQGQTVRYETGEGAINKIRAVYSDDSRDSVEGLLNWYNSFDVLILDELGGGVSRPGQRQEQVSRFEERNTFELIDWRIRQHKKLVICTNKNRDDAVQIYGDERIPDRLWARTDPRIRHIILTAESYR